MYRGLTIAAIAPVVNEDKKIVDVVRRVPRDIVDEVVVVDDGSTDQSAAVARELGATVLSLDSTTGVGNAIRVGYMHALAKNYDVAVVMAGNNKDSPEEIPQLVDPIAAGQADFVQGSRFLKAKANFGPMPVYRKLATRVHPLLFSLAVRRRVSDSTNGFRAIRCSLLRDERIKLDQSWLRQYELEPYLLFKAIRLGWRVTEIPVSKVYPPKKLGQTKMKPLTGWWSILRPIVYLGLGLRD